MIAVRQWVNHLYFYLLSYTSLKCNKMVSNQAPCVNEKVIADYDYIYKAINYNYVASENGEYDYNYDYLGSCNLF